MSFKLRPYQEKAVEDILEALQEGYTRILVAAPCGSGKGSIIASLMARVAAKRRATRMNSYRALALAHRTVLMAGPNAISERLQTQQGVNQKEIGYCISPKSFKDLSLDRKAGINRPLVVGTVQTAVGKSKLPGFDFPVLIIDEAHRTRTKSYETVITHLWQKNNNLIILGFTATPDRADNKSLGRVYQKIIVVSTHGEMVENRYLVPCEYRHPVQVDLSGVRTRAGEFVTSDLEEVYTDEVLEAIVTKWEEFTGGKKKTIFFTINSMEQAKSLAAILRRKKHKAEAITSDTEDGDALVAEFEADVFDHLVNVNKFTEGLSVDHVECIVLACSTESKIRYVQASSRGARPLWGKDGDWSKNPDGSYVKPNFMLIDCGGNIIRHGYLEDYGKDGFDISEKPTKKFKRDAPLKTCGNCFTPVPAPCRTCPECGEPFPESDSEKGKLLATEVEWATKDPNLDYVLRFKNATPEQIKNGFRANRLPELLLPVYALRGHKEDDAVRAAIFFGYHNGPASMTLAYLKRKTKEKNYWNAYEIIKNEHRTEH